jgi:predicted RNase H-like HicB family nuclease
MTKRRYLIVIEGNEAENFSAYAHLPGCVATGATREEVQREMHDAITFHVEGLRDAGEPIPEPSELTTGYIDVAA